MPRCRHLPAVHGAGDSAAAAALLLRLLQLLQLLHWLLLVLLLPEPLLQCMRLQTTIIYQAWHFVG
jgi:hypothetical protein